VDKKMLSDLAGIVSASEIIPGISIYEIVNDIPPEIPPRSWAYHLSPIGEGHSYAESLTSYFARLAKEHRVTPRILFNHRRINIDEEKNKHTSGLVVANAGKATAQINGSGSTAENWVAMVEGITLQKRLRFHTFISWRAVFNKSMCRSERAWCPSCLEDMRLGKTLVYEQLCWAHKNVQVCPAHGILLETKCPHCAAGSWALCGNSCPGFCRSCNRWLGHHSNRAGSIFEQLARGKADYEIFAAKQIGELISVAPSMTFILDREVAKGSLIRSAERFFDGNMHAFVKFFGLNKAAAYSLWNGKNRIAQLELLLRIGFQAGIPLLDLLTREDSLDSFNPIRLSTLLGKRLSPRLKKGNVLKVLLAALEETPPPSLNEMAERLGYKSSLPLRRYFPQVCDQIVANYQQSSRGKEKRKFSTARIQGDEVIKSALESALKEIYPPSLTHIAKQLGYTSSQSLRSRFPDLCKALADKRLTFESDRRDRVKLELETALTMDPPVSLDSIVEKLGYRTNAVLRTSYPELCRKIRDRWTKYNQTQFMLRVRREVESILVELPPPSLKVVHGRIGVSDIFFVKHFPNEHRSISTRYLEYRRGQSERNKENDRNKIRGLIQDFIKRGIFPSMNAVLNVYPANYLKRPEVWVTIMQAREEFGFGL
jgi:AraC-like DNA-binding protein